MALKDKSTYGEYYWAMQVEAQQEFDESLERVLSIQSRKLINDLGIFDNLPDSFKPLMTAFIEPESAGYGMLLGRFVSEAADGILGQTMNHALKDFNYWMAEKFQDVRIDFPTASTLYQRKAITEELFKARMSSEGLKPTEGAAQYLAQMPYPTVPDLITYARYHGEPDNTRGVVWTWFDVPERDYQLWEWLGLQRFTTQDVQTLNRRGLITSVETFEHFAQIGWSPADRILVEQLGWTVPNAMLLVQGDLHQRQSRDKILTDISIADINPKFAETYLDAILTKPASQDLVAYHLRKDPSLNALSADLQRIGIHPDYVDVYKTLAYPIPPVADIITMAVREAFTPSIAERFGQYEDYPPAFEEWAEKKGLSPEWSKRYWAAHWSLPSAQQGFEMLHRGVIEETELNMLLRALDIMPFWRERLTKIAYRRLSRVDIRRMYNVGVMDEKQVFEAYSELGYNERDSLRMSEFTIKQVLRTQSKFTTNDIVNAYSKYMITKSEARTLLTDIGVRPENVPFILTSAEYKREWKLTDDRVAAIRNLYKRDVYDDNKARAELLLLAFPAERVDVLMEQWYIDKRDEPVRHWTTAQTLGFIKDNLITKERGIRELINIGYDTEHIDTYLRASE